ncbi:leucine-rich repeat extensin-like protein 3 [Iris pallida]|uniref:Leucine-rich repeat extensin-like protein 3 n=1 Tax=Iris pallida TaxID=29817 RepID=A0AAX6DRK0_IRIPA|nr:leucine-rich repeat extensin-like protein 3 [Iris pallida]
MAAALGGSPDEGTKEVGGWIGAALARKCATPGNGSDSTKSVAGVIEFGCPGGVDRRRSWFWVKMVVVAVREGGPTVR